MTFKILCMTWNADGLKICESNSLADFEARKSGITGMFRKSCEIPDFFESIRDDIKNNSVDLVCISTQGEYTTSEFHTRYLPRTLKELNFDLVKDRYLSGIGEDNTQGLRTSIFMLRKHFTKQFLQEERYLNGQFGNSGQVSIKCDYDGRKAGAIASYINIGGAKLLFLNIDLPKGNYDTGMNNLNEIMVRQATLANNRLCIIKIFAQTIYNLKEDLRSDVLFLLSSMNYNITTDEDKFVFQNTISSIRSVNELKTIIYPNDEFRQERDNFFPFITLKEGVDGNGPTFLPTWRYTKNRKVNCNFIEGQAISNLCFDFTNSPDASEFVGWHERILYDNLYENLYNTGKLEVNCESYNGIDEGTIHKSSSLGVIGIFTIKANN